MLYFVYLFLCLRLNLLIILPIFHYRFRFYLSKSYDFIKTAALVYFYIFVKCSATWCCLALKFSNFYFFASFSICTIWNHEKHPWGRVTFNSKITKSNTVPWVFLILQMLPNRATHHKWYIGMLTNGYMTLILIGLFFMFYI